MTQQKRGFSFIIQGVVFRTAGIDFKNRRFLAQEPSVLTPRNGAFRGKKRRFLKHTENQAVTSINFTVFIKRGFVHLSILKHQTNRGKDICRIRTEIEKRNYKCQK